MTMREFIAYLAALLTGDASWSDLVTNALSAGLPEEVDLTEGRVCTSSAADAVMRMKTADVVISACNGRWSFAIKDDGDPLTGTAGEWTLPLLVMYALRGLASWELRAFLVAVTRIEDDKPREFVLNAPTMTNLPLTHLCDSTFDKDSLVTGCLSGWGKLEQYGMELRKMCTLAMSPAFTSAWYPQGYRLRLSSDFVNHDLSLRKIPVSALCALVHRQLHMPD